jgi:enamine deaminase RidA (YjgF/YER057c/UK114 family)
VDVRSIRVNPGAVATPRGYAHAVRTETAEAVWIHVSGQIALDASGAMVGVGDLLRQTEQVYENLAAILEANGATFADVVKMTTFLPPSTASRACGRCGAATWARIRPRARRCRSWRS